jgi:nucleoid-associated protein YgaU
VEGAHEPPSAANQPPTAKQPPTATPPAATPPATKDEPYEVKTGDSLWTIARNKLQASEEGGAGEPTNSQVARYWRKVVAKFMKEKGSRDPDLIFPREKIDLPPVPPAND